jgi:hypothetical protein
MQEFTYEFAGFHEIPSRCHIRILDEVNKPLVIMCSQVPENPGTSVTNMAEYIALDVKKYLEKNNFTLASAISEYVRKKKISEMLGDLINGLKTAKKYSIFALESVKLALEYSEKHRRLKNRVNKFIWVEHYASGVGLHPNGSYAIVRFNEESWEPNWSYVSLSALAKYTGYSEEYFFSSPNESTIKI